MKCKVKEQSRSFRSGPRGARSNGVDFTGRSARKLCLLAALPVAAALLPRVAHGQSNNLIFQVTPGDYNSVTGALTPDVGPAGSITTLGSVTVQTGATPNGGSALSFNGTGGFGLSSQIPQTSNAVTIFAVILAATPTSNAATILSGTPNNLQYRLDGAGGNANDQAFLIRHVSQFGNSSLAVSSSTFTVVDASNDPSGLPNTVVFDSNAVRVGDNNATGYQVGALTAFGAGDLGTGGYGSDTYDEFFNGELAEVQVYDGVLPTAQRQSIESSLAASFGIGVLNPNYTWVGTTGLFTTGSNWNQGTAPNNVSSAIATIGNGGTAQIVTGNTIGLLDFNLGGTTGTGVGNVVHTGGDLIVTQALTVGSAGGTGTYNLSGGTITAGSIVVGSGGTGTFIQSGGSVTLSTDFEVGQSGGTGTYTMTGGSVAYSGPQFLFIYGSTSTPSSINLSGTAVITDSGQIPVVGYNPTGGAGAGVINVSDSASFTSNRGINVGYQNSVGTINISGSASVASAGNVRVGYNGGTGVINLSGGNFTENAGLVEFGASGPAVLNMTGGTFTVNTGNNDLLLSEFVGGTVFNISGGTVADSGSTIIGYRGAAVINLSGTAQYTTQAFRLGAGAGAGGAGTATVNFNGGTLSTYSVNSAGGGGTFNFNGGTLQALGNTSTLISQASNLTINALAGGAFIDTNGFTATVTSAIGGPGAVTKLGAGTLVMSASNTYTGATKITAGTLQLATPSLNLSFETPSVGGYFQYAPSGASWTFTSTGGNPKGAGIVGGGGFTFTGSPPDGNQAAFVQRFGSVSQAFNFPTTGTYTLSFYTEQRPGQNQDLQVTLDTPGSGGQDLSTGGFFPNVNWTQTTYTFTETAGSHTLAFVGLDPANDDETAYVDAISFSPSVTSAQGLNSFAVPSVSPVVISAGATFDINSEIVTVGSLAGASSASVALGVGALTIGGDGTSPSFAGSISGAGTVTKIGAGIQTFSGSNTYTGGTNVSGGALVLASPGAFPAFTSLAVASGATVTLSNHSSGAAPNALFATALTIAGSPGAWTGLVDLGNNDLVVRGGSLATVTSQVAEAYAYGRWNGPGGITSTAAASDSRHLTAVGVIPASQYAGSSFYGQTIQSTDVLVKYTYYGDANLDGVVDGSDYSRIDSSYGAEHFVNGVATSPVSGWGNGDFNYDGMVDGSDYTLIDNSFNNQTLNLSTAALVATSTAEVAGPAAVPEPAVMSVIALAAVGLLGRRRRLGGLIAAG